MLVGSKVSCRGSRRVYTIIKIHDDGTFTGKRDDGRIRHIKRPEEYKNVEDDKCST